VLEPIFETDFQPCSYGFRPKTCGQDAIAEIHVLTNRSYEWVWEADIEACFDEISHPALLQRVRDRTGDKRILSLLRAFLKAGILSEEVPTVSPSLVHRKVASPRATGARTAPTTIRIQRRSSRRSSTRPTSTSVALSSSGSSGPGSSRRPTLPTPSVSFANCRCRQPCPGPAWINKPQEITPAE